MHLDSHIFRACLLLLLSMSPALSLAQQELPFRIEGSAPGMSAGKLYFFNGTKRSMIEVKEGRFVIEGKLSEPVGSAMLAKSDRPQKVSDIFRMFIEPREMKLVFDSKDFSKSKLTGSRTQQENDKLNETIAELRLEYKEVFDAFDKVRAKYNDARKAGAGKAELDKIKEEDYKIRAKMAPYNRKSRQATLDFINSHPDSYVSLFQMRFMLSRMRHDEAQAMFAKLGAAYKSTTLGKEIARDVARMSLGIPGVKATNFDTTDLNDKPIKLADFRGKYLLIDFWASWCVPCRKGNPHLISLFKKYHDQGLEILGVSDDDRNPKAWRQAVEEDKIGIWHHVLRGRDPNADIRLARESKKDISNGYNISLLPTKILIGPDGVVIGRYTTGYGSDADLDAKLAEIFAGKN